MRSPQRMYPFLATTSNNTIQRSHWSHSCSDEDEHLGPYYRPCSAAFRSNWVICSIKNSCVVRSNEDDSFSGHWDILYLFIYALPLVSLCRRAVRTYHGAVTGRGDALPVLTPLAAPRVGRAARTVREPEALLVCTVCERDTETNQQVRLLLWRRV